MQFSDPISDYIKRTTLTTKGDILQEGEVLPERLGIGTNEQILVVNGVTGLLQYESLPTPPQVGFNNLQTLSSNITLSGSEQLVFSGQDISVVEGDIYEIVFAYNYYYNSQGYFSFKNTNDSNNTAEVKINGAIFGDTFSYDHRNNIYGSGSMRNAYSLILECLTTGVLDLKVTVTSSATPAILYTESTRRWVNKLN